LKIEDACWQDLLEMFGFHELKPCCLNEAWKIVAKLIVNYGIAWDSYVFLNVLKI
jgi:hypothetical protein